MLVWGAWREAFERAVAAHRGALGRHAVLAAHLRADPAGHRQAAELEQQIRASAMAATIAAKTLPAGWLGDDWDTIADAAPALGSHPADGEIVIRIGTGRPIHVPIHVPEHVPVHVPVHVPIHVPLLTGGHLTVDAPVHDAPVAALFQSVLLRVLAALPAGSVRVLAYDPTGLGQVFAPLRPLIDAGVIVECAAGRHGLVAALDEADDQVRHLMRRPDEPAGPLLLLALAGLPAETDKQLHPRLVALTHAGPAAGVGLLICDWPPPGSTVVGVDAGNGTGTGTGTGDNAGPPAPRLARSSELTRCEDGWRLRLPEHAEPLDLPIVLDPAPGAATIEAVCRPLAAAAAAADRLSFDDLLTDPLWPDSSAEGLATPIGRTGRSTQILRFDDANPHWLVGGRSGSGKTVFLLDVLAGLTARYSPAELSLYLLDFKEGVSFSEFTPTVNDPTWVPHAVAVGVESDREYGVAVLGELRREMNRRATEFKRTGVTKLSELRQARPDVSYPRVLAVIDEFQVLFAGNDPVARQATVLLEDVARKGRSYGVHLVLASQTTAGIEALQTKTEAIFGQFPTRVALAGGGGVLDALNTAADGLPVGTAVVNRSGGVSAANSLVRVPFAQPASVARLRHHLWQARPGDNRPPAVFAGFAAQHVTDDPTFTALTPDRTRPVLLLGRQIAVGSPTATAPLDAVPGRHLGILGPSGIGADVLHAAALGLGRQHRPGTARFLIAPLVPAGDAASDGLRRGLQEQGHQVRTVPLTALGETLADLSSFRDRSPARPTYLILFGADSAGPTLATFSPDSMRTGRDDLQAVAQQGPLHGVHLLGWWRSVTRFGTDLGPSAREDVAALMILNVPAQEVQSLLGQYDLHWESRPNRALLLDRHDNLAQVVVPFVDPQRDIEELL